jgi:hypothetical protein
LLIKPLNLAALFYSFFIATLLLFHAIQPFFFVGLIGAVIISVWLDKIKQQKKRQTTRKRHSKK